MPSLVCRTNVNFLYLEEKITSLLMSQCNLP
jgi:hypothetical protein